MGDVTRMYDVVSVARGYPTPNFFCQEMLFFTYFTKIRTHWTTKNWRSVPHPL